MSCTGCEASVTIGNINYGEFPKLWRIGYDAPDPDHWAFYGLETMEAVQEAAGGEAVTGGAVSTTNVSSAWYDPVAAQGGQAAHESLGVRHGWRFTANTPPAQDSNDPSEIYVVPLRYRVTLVDGTCSGSGASCSTGAACRGLFEIDLEISSTKRTLFWPDEGLNSFPTPKTPTSAGIADPNVEAQNIQITYSSGVGYNRNLLEDPRGSNMHADEEDAYWYNNVTKEMKVSFYIEPSACGEAASWNSNLADWLMHFDGYTMQSDDYSHVIDESFYMAILCQKCQPVTKPGNDEGNPGSQGGGKNFNQSSI